MVFTAQQQIARYVQEQEELASIHTVPLATVRGTGLARGTGPAIISTGPPSRTFVNAYPQYPASDSIEVALPKTAASYTEGKHSDEDSADSDGRKKGARNILMRASEFADIYGVEERPNTYFGGWVTAIILPSAIVFAIFYLVQFYLTPLAAGPNLEGAGPRLEQGLFMTPRSEGVSRLA